MPSCAMWLLVDMQRLSSPATGILCSSKLHNNETKLWGFGFRFKLQRRNESVRRRVKLVVSAELSKSFSLNLGLDSQVSFCHCFFFIFILIWVFFFVFDLLVNVFWFCILVFDEMTQKELEGNGV